jgi:hypothetical protein
MQISGTGKSLINDFYFGCLRGDLELVKANKHRIKITKLSNMLESILKNGQMEVLKELLKVKDIDVSDILCDLDNNGLIDLLNPIEEKKCRYATDYINYVWKNNVDIGALNLLVKFKPQKYYSSLICDTDDISVEKQQWLIKNIFKITDIENTYNNSNRLKYVTLCILKLALKFNYIEAFEKLCKHKLNINESYHFIRSIVEAERYDIIDIYINAYWKELTEMKDNNEKRILIFSFDTAFNYAKNKIEKTKKLINDLLKCFIPEVLIPIIYDYGVYGR